MSVVSGPAAPIVERSPIIADIVRRHADEAAGLRAARRRLVRAPNQTLSRLLRADDRLAAHLDGLAIAGRHAWAFCDAALDGPADGAVFTSTVRALEERDEPRLERLLALAAAEPRLSDEIVAAFEWIDPAALHGVVASLLAAPEPFKRFIGVSTCGRHRVYPGGQPTRWLRDADPEVRARAVRLAGEVGHRELWDAMQRSCEAEGSTEFWAAWSGVLLGERTTALATLTGISLSSLVTRRSRAFRLSLQAMEPAVAHEVLQTLARDSTALRCLIEGSGIAGDPAYVPWLINHMRHQPTARLAGEAFSLVTGLDLALLDLERKPPEDFESGPNDDPDDPNVDMDEDDGLPWPDSERIQRWWDANGGRFQPGQRYFMGAPVTREHCVQVLKTGYQRQRILAAHYLCLLEPGTPLFNTSAPAWRQQKLLAQM